MRICRPALGGSRLPVSSTHYDALIETRFCAILLRLPEAPVPADQDPIRSPSTCLKIAAGFCQYSLFVTIFTSAERHRSRVWRTHDASSSEGTFQPGPIFTPIRSGLSPSARASSSEVPSVKARLPIALPGSPVRRLASFNPQASTGHRIARSASCDAGRRSGCKQRAWVTPECCEAG